MFDIHHSKVAIFCSPTVFCKYPACNLYHIYTVVGFFGSESHGSSISPSSQNLYISGTIPLFVQNLSRR